MKSRVIVLGGREIPVDEIRRSQSRPRTRTEPRMFAVELCSGEIYRAPDPYGRAETQLLLTTFCLEPADVFELA